jgi:hypothetical protein
LQALSTRLLHLHVPKTAGTAVRAALERACNGTLRVFPHYDEHKYKDLDSSKYDVYSGHYGFKTATGIGGDIITVLRHPVDRYLSVYYFWRQLYESGAEVSPNTTIASKYSIDDFVTVRDEPFIVEEFANRVTWQIAHGSSFAHRRELRLQGKTDEDVFRMALDNLSTFAVVGVQEDLPTFTDRFAEKYNFALKVDRINVTKSRVSAKDVSVAALRRIQDWVYLDLELYENVRRMNSRDLREPKPNGVGANH